MTQTLTSNRCFEITYDIKVRTYDIDFAGHVSNIAYLRWMEDMRLQVFEEHFPLEELMSEGFTPIITSHKIDYKVGINLFDKPTGHMWIADMGAAKFHFEGEVIVNGTVTTKAFHVGVFVDRETMKPVRIPPRIKGRFLELKGESK